MQRELSEEGYQVIPAAEARELLQLLQNGRTPDLLVLDPDIPSYLTKPELISLLHLHYPALPILIYTFLERDDEFSDMGGVVGCLEKGEDLSFLKRFIAELVMKKQHLSA